MPSPPDASDSTGRLRSLAVGDTELVIDLDAGARAVSWTVGGLSLLAHHGDAPVTHGMYPMAPWAGRLRDNTVAFEGIRHELPVTHEDWAMHGTALAQAAEATASVRTPGLARLSTRLLTHPGWPWEMTIDVDWELRPRELTTRITVSSPTARFPAVVGWHPWFRRHLDRGGPLEWSLDATRMAERGADHLPTGRLLPHGSVTGPYDDAFLVPDGHATVRWPGALELEIQTDGTWFVVFDELPDAACLEPQSGPPNGLNDGLGRPIAVVEPGRPHRLVTTWRISDVPPADRAR